MGTALEWWGLIVCYNWIAQQYISCLSWTWEVLTCIRNKRQVLKNVRRLQRKKLGGEVKSQRNSSIQQKLYLSNAESLIDELNQSL